MENHPSVFGKRYQVWRDISYSSLSFTKLKIYSTKYIHYVTIYLGKVSDYSKFMISCQIDATVK